jgi:hypothetical protein
VTLAGCQATRYQPAAGAGGFAEIELTDDIWRVRFVGNAYTTQETARSYWLYRAAELTISKGYDGFEVLPQIGPARSQGGAFAVEGEIRMLKAPFEFVPPRTFGAQSLKAALEPHVNGAKCDTRTTSGNICPHAHDYLLAKSAPKPAAMRAETPAAPSDQLHLKTSGSKPAPSKVETPAATANNLKLKTSVSIPRAAQPATATAAKPKPASVPVVARPQALPLKGSERLSEPTGPCEIKPVMTDQDVINCGARVR